MRAELDKIEQENQEAFVQFLKFEEDIYSFTFVQHLCAKHFFPRELNNMVSKCLLVFLLQLALGYFF